LDLRLRTATNGSNQGTSSGKRIFHGPFYAEQRIVHRVVYNEAGREGIQQLKMRGLAAEEATTARRIEKAETEIP
jgi:hypothetical protein